MDNDVVSALLGLVGVPLLILQAVLLVRDLRTPVRADADGSLGQLLRREALPQAIIAVLFALTLALLVLDGSLDHPFDADGWALFDATLIAVGLLVIVRIGAKCARVVGAHRRRASRPTAPTHWS